MKFILKPLRNVTEEDLINDLIRVSKCFEQKQYISISLYKQMGGKHSDNTFIKYFGSWTNALVKANLPLSRNYEEMKRISDEELINDVVKVAQLLNKTTITTVEYEKYGMASVWTMTHRFGSWSSVLEKANLEQTGFNHDISNIDLFNEIERIWIMLGKQPTTNDMKKGVSKYNLSTYTRRFGGWRSALEAFIEYINGDVLFEEPIITNTVSTSKINVVAKSNNNKNPHRTRREPSNRLKIQVLMRDGNRCRLCGVECNDGLHNIHFDHIIPWSKGGETTLDNLQVLCSDCNLAKGDL
jgi:hypothetical protein